MIRRVGVLFLVLLVLVTGCKLNNTSKIVFSKTDFRYITFNHEDYTITDNEVPKENLRSTLVKDYQVIWINTDTGNLLSKVSNNCCALAITNIFQTSDKQLCIGINDKYFQILLGGKPSNLLSISRVSSNSTTAGLVDH